jgi:hypothetical protein
MTESHHDETGVTVALADMLATGRTFRAPVTASEIRMRARWSSLPRLDGKLVGAFAAVVLLVAVLVIAGPLHTTKASPSAAKKGTSPAGWVAHSVYGLQVSVPKSWSVQTFGGCPDGHRPGTLFLGEPRSLFVNCPAYRSNSSIVSITAQPVAGLAGAPSSAGSTVMTQDEASAFAASAATAATGKIRVVHGIRVEQSLSGLVWSIPSRAVVIVGQGPRAISIMRTLAAATSSAVPAAGIVDGRAVLAGDPSSPGQITAPIAFTRVDAAHRSADGIVTKGIVLDGQYSETLPAGKYRLTFRTGTASCPDMTETVIAGQTITAPPISCSGS